MQQGRAYYSLPFEYHRSRDSGRKGFNTSPEEKGGRQLSLNARGNVIDIYGLKPDWVARDDFEKRKIRRRLLRAIRRTRERVRFIHALPRGKERMTS